MANFVIVYSDDGAAAQAVPLSGNVAHAVRGDGSVGAPARTGTAALGYEAGAGGSVTQQTSKSTGVTINMLCGQITLHGAALAAGAIVSFTVTNSQVQANDLILWNHQSVGTFGAYNIVPNTVANGSFKFSIRNTSAGSLSEAIVIRFAVFRAATN